MQEGVCKRRWIQTLFFFVTKNMSQSDKNARRHKQSKSLVQQKTDKYQSKFQDWSPKKGEKGSWLSQEPESDPQTSPSRAIPMWAEPPAKL